MKSARSTDIKNRFGQYLDTSMVEPVLIEKNGRPVAVMLSIADYERLTAIEDEYWGEKAKTAEKEGFIGKDKSLELIQPK